MSGYEDFPDSVINLTKSDKKGVRGEFSRRGFLKGAAIGAAAVSSEKLLKGEKAEASSDGFYPKTNTPPTEFDFTQQSGALQPDGIVDSACQFCNSLCRLKVHVKDGRIIDVLGEPDDPVQAGGLCVKGPMMTQLAYNRFRLKSPMKRVAGAKGSPDAKFEPISWDEALAIIATRFLALRDAGEARAIANKTSGVRLQVQHFCGRESARTPFLSPILLAHCRKWPKNLAHLTMNLLIYCLTIAFTITFPDSRLISALLVELRK